MQKELSYDSLPFIDELKRDMALLAPPFSAEIRQGLIYGPDSLVFDAYCEWIDCETVQDLYDFLTCSEHGVNPESGLRITILDDNEEIDI